MSRMSKTAGGYAPTDDREDAEISEVLSRAPDVPHSLPGATESDVNDLGVPEPGVAETLDAENQSDTTAETTKEIKFLGEVDSEDSESSSDDSTASCSDTEFENGLLGENQGGISFSAKNTDINGPTKCKEEHCDSNIEPNSHNKNSSLPNTDSRSDVVGEQSDTNSALSDTKPSLVSETMAPHTETYESDR